MKTDAITAADERWTTFAAAESRPRPGGHSPIRLRRVVTGVVVGAVAVLVAVGVAGALVSRRTAESQAVHEAAELSDVVATSVVQPVLTDAMTTDRAVLGAALDPVVRSRVLSHSIVRVKVWAPDGTILYSDEPRLIGARFALDEGERAVLTSPQTRAEVSDLKRPENRYESGQGKLLEVYRPVWTPSGAPLLFETYLRYDAVAARSSQLWRGFSGIMLSSLVAIVVLLIPLVWALVSRARRAQAQKESAMQHALDASDEERRHIAATLHDGPVQELAAAAFAVSAAAEQARRDGAVDHLLDDASATVRSSISALRTLLVDIYPASLHASGLGSALRDVSATLASRGPAIEVDIDDAAAHVLTIDQQEGVFRIVQELLRNAVAHSGAAAIQLMLSDSGDAVDVVVNDDGSGFDPQQAARPGHFGLDMVADRVVRLGARLRLRSYPGTAWILSVPKP